MSSHCLSEEERQERQEGEERIIIKQARKYESMKVAAATISP